jgi:hypothetical protein
MRKVLHKVGEVWPVAVLACLTMIGVTNMVFAQVIFPQISASAPAGAFNIFPIGAGGLSYSGNVLDLNFVVQCTPAAATSCTATSPPVIIPSGYPTPAATPFCVYGDDKATAAVYVIAVQNAWTTTNWTDAPTLLTNASTSSPLRARIRCTTE